MRRAARLTQEDVDRPGLSWRTVQQIEAGRSDPRASTLLRLAAVLGVTLGELLDDASPARAP